MTNHEIVRGLMDGFLFWRLTFDRCSFHKVDEVVKAIGSYNAFNPLEVSGLLKNLLEKSKDDVISIEVGREYSPAVYVELRKDLAAALMKEFEGMGEAKPDELDCKDSPITDYAKVRAWWD